VEEGGEWWCREIWRLQSTWSPRERQAFLTFLTDPMDDTPKPKIWAVQATATRSTSREPDGSYTLSLGRGWAAELPQLIRQLNALRDVSRSG
jgi:hypothetical protein